MKSIILGFFLCLIMSANTFASTGEYNLAKLETYPKLGSAEGILDVTQLLYLQKTRTKAECAAAQAEANGSGLELFFGGKHGLLSPSELKKVEKELKWLTTKTRVKILYYKTKFNRPRPYKSHSQIKPCIELEDSKSYPSGHTTLARLYGRILSVIYPERSLLFMKRADEASQHRMTGGVHYPSDVAAGKKLGDMLAQDYLEDGDRFYRLKSLVSDVSN